MELPLQVIEDLAPDQSSLAAAKKLLSANNWPMLGQSQAHDSIWGQCKGSGANPYLTMADVVNHGYKCTCPSRKFPCKHVLALMWIYNGNSSSFAPSEPPEWVMEWLSRRRRPAAVSAAEETLPAKPAKDIQAAETEAKAVLADTSADAEALAKKAEQKQQRAIQTELSTQQAVQDGLAELELWIRDQLRTGLMGLSKALRERTRRISARLVDAKAPVLASRIDELYSMSAHYPLERQVGYVLQELAAWLLLSRAYQLNPKDPDARRALIGAENREQLETLQCQKIKGRWLCLGEKIETRRDGLVSHSSYLWPLDTANDSSLLTPALLLDHHPASVGKRQSSLRAGTQLEGELVFYPSRLPQRALLADYSIAHATTPTTAAWQTIAAQSVSAQLLAVRQQLPWALDVAVLVGPCSLLSDDQHNYWLKTAQEIIPLSNSSIPAPAGGPLLNAFIVWNGQQAEVLTAVSSTWGVIAC
jgi:hypothetical protein